MISGNEVIPVPTGRPARSISELRATSRTYEIAGFSQDILEDVATRIRCSTAITAGEPGDELHDALADALQLIMAAEDQLENARDVLEQRWRA